MKGEFRTDYVTRLLYSTDASIYQIEPLGVFFPDITDDLAAVVGAADQFNIPILPRGSGSSLAGQAIGPALIIDCSRHLNHILEINVSERYADVEPGVILSSLNNLVGNTDLQFGPDPASAERATMGGVIANNATGAHSIRYGMAADNLISANVVLSDGSFADFKAIDIARAEQFSNGESRVAEIYRTALSIRSNYPEHITNDWPKTWRRASGYNLNYLLPWSPSKPQQWFQTSELGYSEGSNYPPPGPGKLNLAALIAGSEGTLGIVGKARVQLVPKPSHTILGLISFPTLEAACEAVSDMLELSPAAIELIPANMIRLAGTVPAYAHQIEIITDFVGKDGGIPNLLVVEFAGDDKLFIQKLAKKLEGLNFPSVITSDPDHQQEIWNVRKVGLGLLMSKPGDHKPIPFIEDLSIPVEKLTEFVLEMEALLKAFHTQGDFYAHASVGCLHIRPLVNLKSLEGVSHLREIAEEAVKIVKRLGGVPSGEHGDGLARSEWLPVVYGKEIYQAFQELKRAADPKNLLNPGKIIDPQRMDENLRYEIGGKPLIWETSLDFSPQGGLLSAVELCNGAGVCRKQDGVMCPSFQATSDEMHSTRGRANLLRALLTDKISFQEVSDREAVFKALDLCLACKGCKAECPSAVDMAKLKYEFLNRYYRSGGYRHPLRDYLFGYLVKLSHLGSLAAPITNLFLDNVISTGIGEKFLGLTHKRELPALSRKRLSRLNNGREIPNFGAGADPERVLFLSDPFTEYYQPEIGFTALDLLAAAGCDVEFLDIIGSGRTLISKGFLKPAKTHARRVINEIIARDPNHEASIVGIEPSEVYTLRDEYPDLLPSKPEVKKIAERAMMIDEYLIRPGREGRMRILRIVDDSTNRKAAQNTVFLHNHCYQKTLAPAKDGYAVGGLATAQMLEKVGYRVENIESGCCGMAGAFGYEKEHYDISMKIGELSLFPRIRETDEEAVIASSGFSCLTQIRDGTGREPVHPLDLLKPILVT